MANKVLLKKSSVGARVPVVGDLDYGELALNYADGKLYYKTSSNTIKSFTEDSSVVTLTGTQTLTNKTLTSPALTTPSVTGLASFTTTTAANAVNITYNPSATTGYALSLTGKDSLGGTGYFDFFKITNTTSGATNPNKSFRLNNTGNLEIINSAYTTVILSLSDAGQLVIPALNINGGSITAGGTTGTSGQILSSTGTGVQWITSSAGSSGTVTSIVAGTGLSGGTITTSGTIAIDSTVATLTGTQTLTNKSLTSPTVTGTLTAGGSAGTNGYYLQSTGSGVQWSEVSTTIGYNNSSLSSFPSGDYNGADAYVGHSGSSTDAFGVSLLAIFTCMDPVGSLQTTDLGVLT